MAKKKVKNCQELAQAVNDGIEVITITEEGLTRHVQKIKAVGKTAWILAAGAIAAAITSVATTVLTGGAASPITGPSELASTGTALTILGPTAITAISIAFAGGGVAVLNSLRKYSLEMKDSGTAILRK